jgi:UDP-3-O-[3-hydroxymyristoyl] glucosamine N-acyltransferase
MKRYYIDDIKKVAGDCQKILGNRKAYFTNACSISVANRESLIFVNSRIENDPDLLNKTRASIIICDSAVKFNSRFCSPKCYIIVDNPKLAFLRIMNLLYKEKTNYGIHSTAVINPKAKIHNKTYIGPFTYIGECSIGEGTVIHGHCHIYSDTIIGNNVFIHAGSIIGADGFGYEKNQSGYYERFPHKGNVVIEDNVEIGANSCIDRGALGSTLIKSGTKIDNLVHVGHNVLIGNNCLITANVMIAGSVIIEDDVYIAPSVSIIDHVRIGKKSFIGLGSVVTKNVPDEEVWVGSPARPLNEFKKVQKKLNE